MTQSTVQQLPAETIKLITSTQIVTSVATAVKELLENSIDAGAKVIQVRLENYGLDLIEVKDDGSGVSYDNVQKMFLPGYTSKIKQYEDLDNLGSYGFRGEALAALCKIATVFITTKTNMDTLAMTYEINPLGLPVSSKPSHLNNGTVITVSNLFSNLPVRRLFLSAKKKLSEELKKTEQIIQSLSLIHPELSVSLIHNKCPIWRKNSVKGVKQSFMQVAGLKVVSKMEYIHKFSNNLNLDLIVPKKKLENVDHVFTSSPHCVYVFVNKRPVNCKILSQPVQEHIFHHYNNLNLTLKHAVSVVAVDIPPEQTDINLEPNKTKILLKNQIQLIKLIDEALKDYYCQQNFTCTTLMLEIEKDYVEEKEKVEKQLSKRLKLAPPEKTGSEKSFEEIIEKKQDWDVEKTQDDSVTFNVNTIDMPKKPEQESCYPQSLCSQINNNNCVLTTEEVSNLNMVLNETNYKLLISANSSNSESRLIERNDIQSRAAEKPVLKEWPCRPKVILSSQPSINKLESKLDTSAVEKIAQEIEKSAEEWSSKMMSTVQGEKNEEKEKSTDVLEEEVNQFDLSMQSISSQMGKKEMKAFTKFARIMRPKICGEFPNIKFTQVAGILADRWKALTSDEVKHYEKMADVVDTNRKIHQGMKLSENSNSPAKPKNSSIQKTSNLKTMFENLKKKKILRPPRQEVSFDVSVDKIKRLSQKTNTEIPDCDICIIGKLHPSGNWLYIKGKEIGHVRHQGLQELIVSQKMLNSFSVPRKPLEKSIAVNEEILGTVLWNLLISLESEWDASLSKCLITADVIIKNGFLIEIVKSGENISSANIIEVAEAIPHFGVSELKDTLRMFQKTGEIGGLVSWRPTSVLSYITNEAVRIVQQSTQPPDREEIENMMSTYHLCFRHLPPVCLHSKEIFPFIFNLENGISEIQKM